MMRAVQIIEYKKAEREAQVKAKKEKEDQELRNAEEELARRNRKWYKFW